MPNGATALTLLLPEATGRARELTSTDMPVLSEDSGEWHPWLDSHRAEDKSLPSSPRLDRKHVDPMLGHGSCLPANLGNESLGRECLCARVHVGPPGARRCPLHWPHFVFLTLSPGLHETLALLTSQLRPDSNHKEEMGFLRDVFSEKSLSYLMKVKPHFIPSGKGF